ncbi:MAG: aminoglycoside adenylyltransferase domain-containing protein [Streptosporangiaceae bacterium]
MSQAREPQLLQSLPAPVRTAAATLRDEVRIAFGTSLHALYLYGAVIFPESEGTGDLDYHAILTGPPDHGQRAAYAAACTRLAGQPGCDDLDGWVIELAQARGSVPPVHLIRAGLRDDAWALHRAHWLAGKCVVLDGPPPATIVAEPDHAELHQGLAAEFRFAQADQHDAFAVLNCCRILRSLAEHDVVQSKFGSGWWALDCLPAEHAGAITAAMNSYRGRATADDAAVLAAGRRVIEDMTGAALR